MMALKMLLVVTTTSRSPSDWVVSIQNKDLMSDPHCETGSQDVVAISAANESLITLHEVTALRFLLRQPSPNWKSFSINDITVSHTLYDDSLLNSFVLDQSIVAGVPRLPHECSGYQAFASANWYVSY